jgi:capsular exopolysaccharide synthesis family protein
MAIREYTEILWRRKWIIIVTFVVVMTATILITLLTEPMYRSSAMMRVLSVSGSSSDWIAYDTRQVERLMNTYAEFATSRPVLQELSQRLELQDWPQITVEILTNTELMIITAEARDPVVAMDTANALTEVMIAQSRELYTGGGKTAQEILGEQLAQVKGELDEAWIVYENLIAESPESADQIAAASRAIELKEETYATLLDQYERNRVREAVLANTLSVIEPAAASRNPAKPRKELNLALGFVLGLGGGVALAFLVESLDTTLYSVDQIKRSASLPVLGKVPAAGRQVQDPLFNGSSPQGEAFRRLRTNLFTLDHEEPLRTLLITSAEPREGKSTTVANLAFAVAQSGRQVVAVDAHLRLPTLHKVFGLSNRIGLSSILEEKTAPSESIQRSKIPGVDVITSGPLPANPAELLSSPQMANLIEQLVRHYDMILLDTPSVLAVTDAAALSRSADGVILIVERAQARQESVRAAAQQLSDVKANPIGVVVNRSEPDGTYDYYQRVPT